MSLVDGIKAELVQATPTSAFLAGGVGGMDRVFPLVIPQQKPGDPANVPAVVYGQSNVDRQALYCGTSGTVGTRLTLDCYAPDYDDAVDLANAVRLVLQDFRGLLGGIFPIKDAKLEDEIDLQDIDPGLFRRSQSWVFWHLE